MGSTLLSVGVWAKDSCLGGQCWSGAVYLCQSWGGEWEQLPSHLKNNLDPSGTYTSPHFIQLWGEGGRKASGFLQTLTGIKANLR